MLSYDPETGLLYWRISRGRCRAGTIAGTEGNHGYIQIQIGGTIYLAHHLVWFYAYGYWALELDHKDTIKAHNQIENLREVTSSQNKMNSSLRLDNYVGVKGVTRCRDKFQARITANGTKLHLGTFDTIEEATNARKDAEVRYHGEFANKTEV